MIYIYILFCNEGLQEETHMTNVTRDLLSCPFHPKSPFSISTHFKDDLSQQRDSDCFLRKHRDMCEEIESVGAKHDFRRATLRVFPRDPANSLIFLILKEKSVLLTVFRRCVD